MAAMHEDQNSSHHATQNCSCPSPSLSAATQQDRKDGSKRPEVPIITSIPPKSKPSPPAQRSAPMEAYLRSEDPVTKRVSRGITGLPSETANPQAKPAHTPDIQDNIKALDEWMAEVTAHLELAMRYRDLDRVPPSAAQIYAALPSNDEDIARNDSLRKSSSQESMQLVLFCTCCPPDHATEGA